MPFRILLADDDTDDCFFFEKALREIPIKTHLTIFRDGEQLMEHMNNNSKELPNILFLDLSMPRKTGFECLSEIKENNRLKDIPVIVFTTSFTSGIEFEQTLINTLSNIGSEEYIRKPSDFEQLKKIIHDALIRIIEKNKM